MIEPDITVLLTTFNNCRELRRTLEGFLSTDRSGLRVEFVVVDNNSTDETKQVIEDFANNQPVHYLFEPRQGKCAALNLALATARLGKLVFFTDDDVDVPRDLLHELRSCAVRHPYCRIFGGHVHLIWPNVAVPEWSNALAASSRAYSHLDLGAEERVFPANRTPIGTNWWIRKEVLQRGYRFDERIGPGAARCSMGDETAFLLQLVNDGFSIVYTPKVSVGHRISPRLLTQKAILRRALASGVSGALLAYGYGFGRTKRQSRNLAWTAVRAASLAKWYIWYLGAFLSLGQISRIIRHWDAMQGIGWNIEALRLAFQKEQHTGP